MGIGSFPQNFGDEEIATTMGKIWESFGWGEPNILGNTRDKFPKKLKFRGGGRDSISGEFGLTTRKLTHVETNWIHNMEFKSLRYSKVYICTMLAG